MTMEVTCRYFSSLQPTASTDTGSVVSHRSLDPLNLSQAAMVIRCLRWGLALVDVKASVVGEPLTDAVWRVFFVWVNTCPTDLRV
jgi:hypothetical protein